ncbi:MAG: hypothetical protein V5A55_07120 [Halovenus sp.]
MAIDRRLVLQVGLSVVALALFVGGLVVISGVYGFEEQVEDRDVTGSVEGDVANLTVTDGQVEGTLDGTISSGFDGQVEGTLTGTVDDGQFEGTFEGNVSGALDGTITGDVNGTLDTDEGTFSGEFDGTASGTTDTAMNPTGALALVVLIVGFIIVMPIFGYIIERANDEE